METIRTSSLDQIEKQAYQAIWEDGLIDIFVGLALFLIGVLWLSQDSAYGSFVAPILVPFWVVARKRISEPRMGVVNFSTERVASDNKKLLGLFLIGVMTLVIGVAWYFVGQHGGFFATLRGTNVIAGLPAVLLAIPATIVALAFGLRRFFVYAAVLLISALPVIFLDLRPGWALVPSGAWCIVAGGVLLTRFVRKYPLDK